MVFNHAAVDFVGRFRVGNKVHTMINGVFNTTDSVATWIHLFVFVLKIYIFNVLINYNTFEMVPNVKFIKLMFPCLETIAKLNNMLELLQIIFHSRVLLILRSVINFVYFILTFVRYINFLFFQFHFESSNKQVEILQKKKIIIIPRAD